MFRELALGQVAAVGEELAEDVLLAAAPPGMHVEEVPEVAEVAQDLPLRVHRLLFGRLP